MVASALAPLLTTAFSAGGIGTAIVGGLISGLGAAKMQEAKMDKEEGFRIAEEKRLQDSYAGAGDAVQFWDQGTEDQNNATQGQDYERADPNSNQNLTVGQRETRQAPGQKYRINTQQQPKRYQYDPMSGRIVQA